MLLEVKELRYSYGDRLAVAGASFELERGEIFGLLGPNGAGKTTTLSCVAGGLADWQGEMRFDGRPFAPARMPEDRARLGVVPQELALYPELTARENLQFFGRLSGLEAAELAAACDRGLALAGLDDRADDRVSRYSGGMKRRLNLVLGDLHAPELLLLDEPTVGVDPQSRNHIFEALEALRESGRTLLYTTHYMEEAQRLCDRVAIIHEGRVVGAGTPKELAAQAGVPDANLEEVFLRITGHQLRDGA
ncbi:MAG TPA: ABC transporter ATP-binding protein [Planctomycetota bacterium]